MKIKDMCLCSLFAVLIGIGAFIKLPISIVPVTLQTLFVILSALMLKQKAVMSVALYIVIGLLGIPVFTSGGGIGYVFMPSFGYLLGFLVCAVVVGYRKNDQRLLLRCILGMLVIYVIGVLYFTFIEYFYYQQIFALNYLIVSLFLVYIPGDLLSIIIAILVYKRFKTLVS